jgi:gamma-glutamyltranspeptidase / glutathione hydrolase
MLFDRSFVCFSAKFNSLTHSHAHNLRLLHTHRNNSGGPKIISAVFRVLVNHLFLGMDLWQAIVDPRLHDQLIYHGAAVTTFEQSTVTVNDDDDATTPPTLVHNITVTDRILEALQKRGHRILEVDYEGTVQAISVDMETKELTAVCDPRKGGSPAGF